MNEPQRNRGIAGGLLGFIMVLLSGGLATTEPTLGTEPVVTHTESKIDHSVDTLIGQLIVEEEGSRSGYNRKQFTHWSDLDRNGCNTREDVLINEAEDGTVEDCTVVNGRWFSIYDGEEVLVARSLDVDHMVPLAEAWDSGASEWTKERRQQYANDQGYEDSLIAVTGSSNRSKGDKDPAEWTPTEGDIWCRYATAWVTVKVRWELTSDSAEVDALEAMFEGCEGPPPTDVPLPLGQ